MNNTNIFFLLYKLWIQISNKRKKQFIALVILMIFTSFAELITVGSIFPFLAALMSPDKIFYHPDFQWIVKLFGIKSIDHILLPLTIFFIVCVILASFLRLIQLKYSLLFSFNTGAEIGLNIYRKVLNQPYKIHLSRNSSEVIDGITTKTTAITDGIIMSSLYIISSFLMLIIFLFALSFIAPLETLIAFLFFGSFYSVVVFITKKHQLSNSFKISRESVKVIKSLQEGLGGIRDVLLDGSQNIYCEAYHKSNSILRRAYAVSSFISASPRFIVEAIGIVIIAFVAFYFSQSDTGISSAIPTIGAIVLATQRLLPIMQLSYGGLANLKRNEYTLFDTLELLKAEQSVITDKNAIHYINFCNSISLRNISFKYSDNSEVIIKKVNLEIPKGSRIGITGESGSGKSTLLDIIMGLLEPSSGAIFVDDKPLNNQNIKAWQKKIAHVPQHIFLIDSSIEENIALGVSKEFIDNDRLTKSASQAQLIETIHNLPLGMATMVGERGANLSGGQIQRIGIARALYKNADLLILDESTGALDLQTEKKIMDSIHKLNPNITILIIAHRLSALDKCTHIIQVKNESIGYI